MNTDLLVCGFCVVFDEPSEDGRPAERREEYDWFPSFADTLPVRINHLQVITSSGVYDVGRVSHFAIVDGSPPIPSGVLCLVELDDNYIGRGVLDAVGRGELWAFSLGGNGKAEVSLTDRPAFTNCRVVGWGASALAAWKLLTEQAPEDVAAFGGSLGPDGRPAH
jgi:hypothetical protein